MAATISSFWAPTTTKPAVWLSSFPKSGNTMLARIFHEAQRLVNEPVDDHIDIYVARRAKLAMPSFSLLSGISPAPVYLVKTHASIPANHAVHQNHGFTTSGFIYIKRNPLDVLLSYINYTRLTLKRDKWRWTPQLKSEFFLGFLGFESIPADSAWIESSLDDIPQQNLDHALLEFAARATTIPEYAIMSTSWANHVLSWTQMAQARIPSAIIRYEDFIADPTPAIQTIANVFHIEEDILRSAAMNNSQKTKSDGLFFNKMKSYYCVRYFSAKAIQDFLDATSGLLTATGYASLGADLESAAR